ncbi:hypothetical protein IV203_038414 [Nitzschia inconspicua]|uniref:Uncharacterized protein n=1 Tax=Nitzschia inconspicua TaxID=303405 RepID=A0A9K3LQS5_9STRA|nr:hypothetical protein IV203_038414 [Nitzschia inconspicua]
MAPELLRTGAGDPKESPGLKKNEELKAVPMEVKGASGESGKKDGLRESLHSRGSRERTADGQLPDDKSSSSGKRFVKGKRNPKHQTNFGSMGGGPHGRRPKRSEGNGQWRRCNDRDGDGKGNWTAHNRCRN